MLENKFLVAAYIITWALQIGFLLRLWILNSQLKSAAARTQKK
jgi:hypothetical protein